MIYFDNAACQLPSPKAAEYLKQIILQNPVNPESVHHAGRESRNMIATAGERVLNALIPEWRGGRVIFSTSGSDAFNLLLNSLKWPQNGTAVWSKFEHPALIKMLERTGLKNTTEAPTELAVYTHVQSETGMYGEKVQGRLTLCDTIQSAGKLSLPSDADILTISGHKLGAIGGAALLINPKCKCNFDFEANRRNYLSGRLEIAQILLFAQIVEETAKMRDINLQHVSELNQLIRKHLPSGVIPTLEYNRSSPYILHLRILQKQGAVIARMLSTRGVMTSPSSACQAESGGPSAVLTAMGFKNESAFEGLRLSFAPSNTQEEAKKFLTILAEELKNY